MTLTSSKSSKHKLQRHLNHPRAYIRLDLPESRRFDVADRQAEIGMVQHIKQFTAKLKLFRFRQTNVLEGRGVPVHVSRALDYVAAFVPEDLEPPKRVRLELLKGAYVKPFLRRARTGVWVANQIGAVRGKSGDLRCLPLQRNVVRVEYRERTPTHGSQNSVQLPVAENVPIPG